MPNFTALLGFIVVFLVLRCPTIGCLTSRPWMHDERRTMRNVLRLPQVQPKAPFMSTRFDLIDLQLFVHVAEAGSITHGAVRTNMTLASASERIRAMEDALSAPLLERQRRGVQLTSAGRVLLHHAWVVTQQMGVPLVSAWPRSLFSEDTLSRMQSAASR